MMPLKNSSFFFLIIVLVVAGCNSAEIARLQIENDSLRNALDSQQAAMRSLQDIKMWLDSIDASRNLLLTDLEEGTSHEGFSSRLKHINKFVKMSEEKIGIANSILGLLGLKIRNMNIQQEAESKLFLSSASAGDQEEIKVEKENVTFLNDTTAVLDNESLLYFETADLITEAEIEYYIFTGENMRSCFIVENVDATLQATSEMLADEAPVNHYDIKLEGESTADIWAINSLSGKGEGGSALYYKGNPSIDYLTQGNAQIVNW